VCVCVCVCVLVSVGIRVCHSPLSRIMLHTAHSHAQTMEKEWWAGWTQMLGVQRKL